MTEIEQLLDRREVLGVTLSFGRVTVTEEVHAYQRKRGGRNTSRTRSGSSVMCGIQGTNPRTRPPSTNSAG